MKNKLILLILSLFMVINMCLWENYVISVDWNNKEFSDLLFKWYDYYKDKDYESAVDYYEQAHDICNDKNDCEVVEGLLVSSYYQLASKAYDNEDTKTAIKWYWRLLDISPNEFNALVNIWIAYIWEDPDIALSYMQRAKRYAVSENDYELVNKNIESISNITENFEELKEQRDFKALNKTNDPFLYNQYYLYYLNIFKAWDSIPYNDSVVTIAIIDDWIKIDHPDLRNNIWVNNWEILWNWIDDDKNWYVDDYYWWNFVKNTNDITPIWSHWTHIAWIIWARINNNEWMAWIIPNWRVKLMSLVVFWDNWKASDKDVISAINYAIDNWANIINLSLWWEQHEYSDSYNKVIKRANDKWIVVLAAAGNWDESINPAVWINTSQALISPVCNWDYDYSVIWVWSIDKDWKTSSWSNYWKCIDVYTYWDKIFSTSSSSDSLYAIWSWTSFSTPIIAWIVWLWYLKYWDVWVSNVYSALKWSINWSTLDVIKYLDNLSKFKSDNSSNNKSSDSVYLNYDNSNTINNWWNNSIDVSSNLSDLEVAINWMYENWLTIYNTPKTFMSDRYLTREQASKFFVQFANSVLWKDKWLIESYNLYSDIYNADPTLKDFIIYSYNMWLFKWHNGKFMPFNQLSQAQALAVTIRMLDWYLDEPSDSWYIYYFYRAQTYWILWETGIKYTQADNTNITRWDMAIILYNAYKYYNGIN